MTSIAAIVAQTRAEYDATKGRVNFSTIKHLARSPAHYWAALKAGAGDRDIFIRGRATHLAVYEPEKFRSDCVVFPGKRAGKEWEAFVERNPDKEHLTSRMHESAVGVAAAVRACPMAAPYLVPSGRFEVSLFWTIAVPALAGIPGFSFDCKARLDALLDNAIADLKSCKDASPDAFGRQVINLYSHAQAAFYVDAVKAITGKLVPYVWIASEASAPYVTQVYEATPEVLELGRRCYRGWLDRLNVCEQERREAERLKQEYRWPGYADSPMALVVPPWAMPDEEDVLEEEAA